MALRTLLALVCLALPVLAQAKDKERCPYCKEDPALMAAAGELSHAPSAIGDKGGEELVAKLPVSRWLFVETAHLRWASALGDSAIDQRDRERVEAELARLRAVLPDVPTKPRKLDPWLRLHVQAMKGEEFYARFQALLGVKDADFPAIKTTRRLQTTPAPRLRSERTPGDDLFPVLRSETVLAVSTASPGKGDPRAAVFTAPLVPTPSAPTTPSPSTTLCSPLLSNISQNLRSNFTGNELWFSIVMR